MIQRREAYQPGDGQSADGGPGVEGGEGSDGGDDELRLLCWGTFIILITRSLWRGRYARRNLKKYGGTCVGIPSGK